MNILLRDLEETITGLGSLYQKYGYSRYKMNKFEEYDTYVANKDFLISDNIITFTDTDGRLLALKPDVTLSIVKNAPKAARDYVQKMYYNENVYRVSASSKTFKEIPQIGLECIGSVDDYTISEVLCLAVRSLQMMSDDCILDVSHLGILSALFDSLKLSEEDNIQLLQYFKDKNTHSADYLLAKYELNANTINCVKTLISLYDTPAKALPVLHDLFSDDQATLDIIARFETILNAVGSENIRIDFSTISDMRYYNGIVFAGYLQGVPKSVLSGGQYDRLMRKMKCSDSAIGFAIYPDELTFAEMGDYDVDVLLIYDSSASPDMVRNKINELISEGVSVNAQTAIPPKMRYRTLMHI